MAERLAVIPARGGSKRVPRKNIREFHGKPMMLHVLESARKSGLFDEIHVSTDDEEVSGVAADSGFPPAFARPAQLADDITPVLSVVRYVLETYQTRGRLFGTVAVLMATSALIDFNDLQQACSLFESGDRNLSLVSVGKYPAPIEWAYRLAADGRLSALVPDALVVPSRDLDDAYYDAGCFEFHNSATLLNNSRIAYRAFVLPFWKATDIDNIEDWERAEFLFKRIRQYSG